MKTPKHLKSAELFILSLENLKKKYGGDVEDGNWTLHHGLLGRTPVTVLVVSPDGAPYPFVSISWEGLVLWMNREIQFEPGATVTAPKIRWFLRYLEKLDPSLKEFVPHVFREAETYAASLTALKETS